MFVSEKGDLWTENFQIWGLLNWKFPNLAACELKVFKFVVLRAKIWAKIEAVEAKISKFSQKGGLVNWLFCLKWDPCELQERRGKGVSRAAHPHTPFLGQCTRGALCFRGYATEISVASVHFTEHVQSVLITGFNWTTWVKGLIAPYIERNPSLSNLHPHRMCNFRKLSPGWPMRMFSTGNWKDS